MMSNLGVPLSGYAKADMEKEGRRFIEEGMWENDKVATLSKECGKDLAEKVVALVQGVTRGAVANPRDVRIKCEVSPGLLTTFFVYFNGIGGMLIFVHSRYKLGWTDTPKGMPKEDIELILDRVFPDVEYPNAKRSKAVYKAVMHALWERVGKCNVRYTGDFTMTVPEGEYELFEFFLPVKPAMEATNHSPPSGGGG